MSKGKIQIPILRLFSTHKGDNSFLNIVFVLSIACCFLAVSNEPIYQPQVDIWSDFRPILRLNRLFRTKKQAIKTSSGNK
jgi:hypothetical protein